MNYRGAYQFWAIFCLCLCATLLSAQNQKQILLRGDLAFEEADYYTAMAYYEYGLKQDSSDSYLNYQIAECARLTYDFPRAITHYRIVRENEMGTRFELSELHMGRCYQWMGQYLIAEQLLQAFIAAYLKDNEWRDRGKFYLKQVQYALDFSDTLNHQMRTLPDSVNTDFSEFAAQKWGNHYQFTALRPRSDLGEDNYTSALYGSDGFHAPSRAKDPMPYANMSSKAPQQYRLFTQCPNGGCQIFVQEKAQGIWQSPQQLPSPINVANSSSTHPSARRLDNGNYELYFASDRVRDSAYNIYLAELDAQWKVVSMNTWKYNTRYDDWTPFVHPDGQLHFSSEGRMGLGGNDIYHFDGQRIHHLPRPYNSSYNDLYYWQNATADTALITSNRTGAKSINQSHCCNDIFEFTKYKPAPIDSAELLRQQQISDSLRIQLEIANRIEVLEGFIPLFVYFDNDQPLPIDGQDTGVAAYLDYYRAYAQKEDLYKEKFIANVGGTEGVIRRHEMQQFFNKHVHGGAQRLQLFCDSLLFLLEQDIPIKLTLEGYTSPLADADYNLRLSKRRINSLKAYFYAVNEGELLPFLKSGQLVLADAPFGEQQAKPDISDQLSNSRESIYSPRAAAERRVAIIAIERQ